MFACGGNANRERELTKRVEQLEDSLQAYRDTLHSERLSFNFNTISPILKLQSHDVRKGDSCRADLFIAGMNGKSHNYFYHEPLLELSKSISAKGEVIVKKNTGFWTIAFLPTKPGLDSITGTVKLRCQGCSDSTEVGFSADYTVTP